ncbi:MAG TPA: YncE family protein [Deltaproteobacteria bacterium]|nr:YncE family protein [Deltaproteobacteria bacterium]
MLRSTVLIAIGLSGCEPEPIGLTSSQTESTSPPGPEGTPPPLPALEQIETRAYPNGIAADEDHIYVVIGEPHTDPSSLPLGPGQSSVVQVFSTDDGALVEEIEVAGGGHSLILSPTGDSLYVAHFSLDNRVTSIAVPELEVTAEIGGLLQLDIVAPDALAASPDGRWVYVGSNGLSGAWISRIDTTTDRVDRGWRAEVADGFVCWVASGWGQAADSVYANSWTGGSVQRLDAITSAPLASADVGAFPHALALDPTGSSLYVLVSGGNQVLRLDALTLEEQARVTGPWLGLWGGPVSGTLSHSGRHLFVANHALGQIAVVDVDPASMDRDTVVATLQVGLDPIFSALSPDGARLYVSNNASASVSVLDVSTWP